MYVHTLGGGLISGPSQTGEVDMNAVLRRVTNHVQNELSIFKTSFRSDVENHMDNFVNLVSCTVYMTTLGTVHVVYNRIFYS